MITVAFGFRNLTNYRHGLEELARVLKPGGVLAILLKGEAPLQLAFLTPYLEHSLNEIDPNVKVKIAETLLTWSGWERSA